MLDGLLGRGFAAKCKSLIKLTKSRIDVIRRKRRATEKFLKKDMADLLMNGLDINAYGRADGLLVELILSSCYDFVEGSCEFVLKHLPALQKLSGCPEECREAVSSLMFAAARFSDLPELRDLRQIFQERYGNSLECYVNQKFAANLNFKSSTLEKKVCLMQDIASEFSIKWDSKAFELRMSKPSEVAQGHNTRMSNHANDYDKPSHGKDANTTGVKHNVLLEKKSPDHPNVGHRFQNGKETVVLNRDRRDLQSRSTLPGNGIKPQNGIEVIQKRDGHDNPFALGHNTCLSNHVNDCDKPSHGNDAHTTGVKYDALLERSPDHPHVGYRFQNSKETVVLNRDGRDLQSKSTLPVNGMKPVNGIEAIQKRDGHNPLTGRQDVTYKKGDRGYWKEGSMLKPIGHSSQEKTVEQFEGGSKLLDSLGDTTRLRENHDIATARKSPSRVGLHFKSNVNESFAVNHVALPDTDNSYKKVQKDETPKLKPCYSNAIPPPYVKPKSKQQNSTLGANAVSSHIDSDGISTYPSEPDKPDAASTSEKIQIGLGDSDQDWQAGRHKRLSKQSHEGEFSIREDANEVSVSKPKSMRRKHSKSRSSHNDASYEDSGLRSKSRSRSRRRHESRRGLQTMFDDERHQNVEEERLIDKLLIHYSQKPSIIVPEKLRRNSANRHAPLMDNSAGESLQNRRHDGSDESQEMATFPPRSVSLPREQTGAVKIKKVYTRAATFQPDRSNEARHVHPNLPDYDDLAARIAALRGS